MTRSSQTICENILDFDDDFERTLTRKRKTPEPDPRSPLSEAEVEEQEEVESEEIKEAKVEEVMAANNRTIKELSASGLDNAVPLCIQYPRATPDKTDELEIEVKLVASYSQIPWAVHGRSKQAFEGV